MAQQSLLSIIHGIRLGDRQACLDLYHLYYRQIFHAAYSATQDPDQSIRILKAVYKKMLLAAKSGAVEDYFDRLVQTAVEEQLSAFRACQAVDSFEHEIDLCLKDAETAASESGSMGGHEKPLYGAHGRKKRTRRRRSVFSFLGMALLLAVILILLWAIAGLLMSRSFLPYWDLGYAWFNANLFHLF